MYYFSFGGTQSHHGTGEVDGMEKYPGANFIPPFIAEQYSKGCMDGTIDGSVLISDICGFTGLTESLFALHKRGAEKLSEILNRLFSGMIAAVHENGGFVVNFAGDAFTAVFPADRGARALAAAQSIKGSVDREVSAGSDRHITGIRSGIDSGRICWNIYGSGPFTYLFSGEAVTGAAQAEASAGTNETAAAPGVSISLNHSETSFDRGSSDGFVPVAESIEKQFIHPDYIAKADSPEFRDVAAVFTDFRDIRDVNEFVDTVIRTAGEYGGYFNLLDCGDKGTLVLTLFGAPLTSGKNKLRSAGYALVLKDIYGERVRSGITWGRVFAGFIGSPGLRGHYTVIGDKVNISARLMQSCLPGDILISEEMGRDVRDCFQLEQVRELSLKGSSNLISCFRIGGRSAFSGELLFESSFVGRSGELDSAVQHAVSTLSAGTTGGLVISGEAGIGKTRFAHHLQSLLPGTAAVYLKCDEILGKSLNPIESFFEDTFGTSGSEDRWDSESAFEKNFSAVLEGRESGGDRDYHSDSLRRLKYVVKGFMGIDESDEYQQLDARSRFDNTILAFMHLVRLIAGEKRLFLVIDDFQWMDPDTFTVLKDIFRQMDIDGPMICILSRPSPETPPSELLPQSAEILSIQLSALKRDDQRDLVENALPCPPSETLRKVIEEKAEGNPFYIEQMIMYLLDNRLVECSGRTAELTTPGLQLPGSILDIIISRVDALEADIRQTVSHASVLGRRFNIRVLSRMLRGIPVRKHLRTGTEARIWNRLSEIQYIFRHALIRDAVYDMQMDRQLSGLHLLAGNIIEELYADDERMYSDLSHHFEKSLQTDRMLKYTMKAAEYALENFRNRESIEMYQKYIEHQADPRREKLAQLKLAQVFNLVGNWNGSLPLYEEIIQYAEENDERHMLAEASCRKGFLLHRMGNNGEAVRCFQVAKLEYEKLDDIAGLAGVYNNIGTVHTDLNRPEEAVSCFGKALKLLEDRSGERIFAEIMMFTYNNLGLVNQKMNYLEKAAECYWMSMEVADRINAKRNLAALNFGNIKYLQDKVDEAEIHYRKAMRQATEIGDRHLVRVMLNNLAAISTARGEYDEAGKLFEKALTLARSLNDRKGLRLLNQNIGEIKSYMGDYSGSEGYFRRAIEMAEELGDRGALGTAHGKMGSMLFMSGDLERAHEHLAEGIEHTTEAGDLKSAHEFIYLQARVCNRQGRTDAMKDLLRRIESLPDERVSPFNRWFGPMVEAWIEKAEGNHERAMQLAEGIAENFPGTEGEALALLVRYDITGNDDDRKRVIAVYRDLLARAPMDLYRQMIKSLG